MPFYVLVISQSLVVINTPHVHRQTQAGAGVASPVALLALPAWLSSALGPGLHVRIPQPSPGSDFPGMKAGKGPTKETEQNRARTQTYPHSFLYCPLFTHLIIVFFLTHDLIFFFVSILKIFILRTAKQRKTQPGPL